MEALLKAAKTTETNEIEHCAAVIYPNHNAKDRIQIVGVYRPPENPGSTADAGNTERMCQFLRGLRGNVICVGDFNLPDIDWDT